MRSERWFELVGVCPLALIDSDAGLDRATAAMKSLLFLDRTPEEEHYLESLGSLIHRYESAHCPIPDPTPEEEAEAAAVNPDWGRRKS